MIYQLVMGAQAMGEEENLGMKCPGAHILVEVGQVRVFGFRLEEGLPTEALPKQPD
jgi:hypothetical protein